MNRLNRYSFGVNKSTTEQAEPKKRTLSALTLSSFAADAKESEGIAEYKFVPFAELLESAKDEQTKTYFKDAITFCNTFTALRISVSELDNGRPYNRANADRKDGGVTKCRIYGVGKGIAVDGVTISGDDLKKVVFGYCTSAGEYVTANGSAPAIYANISALM